ncbi:MAG: hypothetical protein HY996_10600 [Micrococcales bacterium]|nr:hypothetical protein [Micrococcales bacterium]
MRARLAASACLSGLAALALAGCTLLTPQATLKIYDPGDGVSGKVGDVDVLNVVAVAGNTARANRDANLVLSAVNSTEQDIALRIQYPSGDGTRNRTVTLAPGSNQIGYGQDGQLLLTGFGPRPGALAKIYFQYGGEQGRQLNVPVLDDSWSSYADLGPTPSPTPTPAVTNPPVLPAPIPTRSATPAP